MSAQARPHVVGIDDGPFEKRQREPVPIVGVMMEGPDLVEAVAITRFPVDGAGATEFLVDWIRGLRLHPTLQGIVLGGVTIAGLGVVDIEALSRSLQVPALVVTRRDPANHRLREAFEAAGLAERLAVVERTARAFEAKPGVYLAHAGIERDAALRLLRGMLRKSKLPEPLRVAHLIAAALVSGESRGRV
ncbi:MAG: DUF99 family protein [Deltaproteobacteria bacterium]|nr:MAG: DUF99 family protein [Deltaproteobacteria bacterium]